MNKQFEEQIDLYIRGGMPELQPLKRLLQQSNKGSIAIDIGANIGEISFFLQKYGKVHCVHAFEPFPQAYKKLVKLIPYRIIPHEIALSDREGTAVLFTPHLPDSENFNDGISSLHKDWVESMHKEFPRAVSDRVEETKVSVRTLDSYNFTDVKVIKIDVEGHENQVIDGAQQTIEKNKPILIVEVYHNDDICDKICSLGYSAVRYSHKNRRFKPFLKTDKLPPNLYNLVFLPK